LETDKEMGKEMETDMEMGTEMEMNMESERETDGDGEVYGDEYWDLRQRRRRRWESGVQ
jgi:hypothetical protein